jgi:hypothetical protein
VQTKVIDHDILLVCSTFNHGANFTGKSFGQLLILETFLIAAAAVSDDQVDIVRRYISAPHIAVVITFSIKRTNYLVCHGSLICKNRWVDSSTGKPEGKVVTIPRTSTMQ